MIFARAAALLLLLGLTSGCTAKMRAQRHLDRAEKYFAAGEYEKAKIEYINALRATPDYEPAYARIGTVWLEQGAPLQAGKFLYRAVQLAPKDIDAQLKLTRIFMELGGTNEAFRKAAEILQHVPDNPQALLYLAENARSPEETALLAQTLGGFPDRHSIYYHLAYANLAVRQNNLPAAEAAFRSAIEIDPKSPLPHTGLATLYAFQKDNVKTEAELKAAAELASPGSPEQTHYPEFLNSIGKSLEAEERLKQVTDKAPNYVPAWRLRAQIALNQNKPDQALAMLDRPLNINPDDAELRMIEATARMAKGEAGQAVQTLERLDKIYPNAATIRLQLAKAHLLGNNLAAAAGILNDLLVANPNLTEAALLLGQINLRLGDLPKVVNSMLELLKRQPHKIEAEVMLAEAYRLLGRADDAVGVFQEQVKYAPESVPSRVSLGMALRQANRLDEAQRVLEEALTAAPENTVALDQLVEIDVQRGDLARAAQRVDQHLQQFPKSAAAYASQGKIFSAQHEWDKAVAALEKAIELDPNLSVAYDLLSAVYITSNRLPEAVNQLQASLAKRPNEAAQWMLLALTYEKLGDFEKARDAYEKTLVLKPDFPLALNNLAYIYSEKLSQLDRAADLARKARAVQPANPQVADTLGWILYKQGDYQQAITLLQEAAGKLPELAEVQFHYGMASYMMGQADAARSALEAAANAPTEFPGKDEARKRLALLEQSGGRIPAGADTKTTDGAKQPADVLAVVHSAEAHEKSGDYQNAAAEYEQALKINPKLLPAFLKLAEFYAGPLKNPAKAVEYGKRAREMAPTDPEVARVLGMVAFRAGNWAWAYSLLHESARQMPNDAITQHAYAWAAYSIGKVAEAKQTMQRVTELAPETSEGRDARKFIPLVSSDQAPSAEASGDRDADYVPLLVQEADRQREQGDTNGATQLYQRVLQRFPEFAPAQKYLAGLYLQAPETRQKAYELAASARKSMPDDPELASILGRANYYRKDYGRAAQLLEEANRKINLDAEGLFFLGISLIETKQAPRGREVLQRAVEVGLPEPLAAQAAKAMGEPTKR